MPRRGCSTQSRFVSPIRPPRHVSSTLSLSLLGRVPTVFLIIFWAMARPPRGGLPLFSLAAFLRGLTCLLRISGSITPQAEGRSGRPRARRAQGSVGVDDAEPSILSHQQAGVRPVRLPVRRASTRRTTARCKYFLYLSVPKPIVESDWSEKFFHFPSRRG